MVGQMINQASEAVIETDSPPSNRVFIQILYNYVKIRSFVVRINKTSPIFWPDIWGVLGT